jgi:steroid 5-alpha reductase family enzyme
MAVFAIGFLIEVISDKQLVEFVDRKTKARAEGKEIERFYQGGLWKYSRHPNYFGEVLLWWGIWIMSLGAHEFFWTDIFSPIIITLLLRFVSGVPFLEKRKFMKDKAFKKYSEETPIFVPWFPSKAKSD